MEKYLASLKIKLSAEEGGGGGRKKKKLLSSYQICSCRRPVCVIMCVCARVPSYTLFPHNELVLRQKQTALKNRHWQLAHGSQQRELGTQPSETSVHFGALGTLATLGGGPLGCAGCTLGLWKGSTPGGQRLRVGVDFQFKAVSCYGLMRAESTTSFLENCPRYQSWCSTTVIYLRH